MNKSLELNPNVDVTEKIEQSGEIKRYVQQYAVLMLVTAFFIVLVGIGSYLRESIVMKDNGAIPSFEVRATMLDSMLVEELPHYESVQAESWLSPINLTLTLFQMISSASLLDVNSIVKAEMLYSSIDEQSTLIHSSGQAADPSIVPIDTSHTTPIDNEFSGFEPLDESKNDEGVVHEPITSNMDAANASGGLAAEPVAFIYHTHNRESWNNVSDNKNAQSKDNNITLIGERLAEELEALGLHSMVSSTDYPTEVPDYEWEFSYKHSKKTVKEALASNNNIQYVFDLHRDSQPKEYTTIEIDGQTYAQVYFIIGQRNPNWENNKAFAVELHDRLEAKYPGLSRGIWGKNANSGNAEYNQSLFDQSVLIEVGGVDNTLEENYRTAKALAEVIAELHFDE